MCFESKWKRLPVLQAVLLKDEDPYDEEMRLLLLYATYYFSQINQICWRISR